MNKTRTAPETMVYTGNKLFKTEITHLQYDSQSIRETRTPDSHPKLNDWIMIHGLKDVDYIKKICDRFGVDPLVTEDVLNVHQRNKLEIFEDYIFSVNKFAYVKDNEIHHEYISMLLFEDKLITFQEQKTTFFDPIIKRIKEKQGNITKMGHGFLYYSILDSIIDENIESRKLLSRKIMLLEDDIINLEKTDQSVLYNIRKELLYLKNSNKHFLFSFTHKEYEKIPMIKDDIFKYYEDLTDHIVRLDENIDVERELLGNLLDVHNTNVSNKMNRIMTVLTIFSAIFIPLSFLAGVFGMNFSNFSLLESPYGLTYFTSICIVIAVSMISFFRYKKWL